MVKHDLPAILILGFGLSLACAEQKQPAPAKADPAAVARWVAQLGSNEYEEREAAYEALERLGGEGLDAVRKAVVSRDEETRRRAIDLVHHLEKRLENEQLTQPKLVHLVYKDTPLPQAVQDIARKTGFQIQLEGNQTGFANRKITLDTGEVPFWQAVDQFCSKAGLMEKNSVALAETPVNQGYGREVMFLSDVGYMGPRPELPLVLVDGKTQPLPTHYAGAVRIRVLPRAVNASVNSATPLHEPEEGILMTVQVSPEPRLGLQTILNVRIEKLVDEKGYELKTPAPYISELVDPNMMAWAGGWAPNSIDTNQTGQDFSKRVPIRLRLPEGVKKLTEIRGSVAAEVLTPMQPLITVDDILNAADRTAAGRDGGSLHILEVKRDDKGQVVVRVVVEKAPTRQAAFAGGMGGVIMFPGGGAPQPQNGAVNAIAEFLSLVDDKNQAFKLTAAEDQARDNLTNEYRLTFQPPSGAPKPAKLVFSGRRQTTIDVPFVLKDVPLR